jgi:cell wall-associated NlpC family hydrolase
MHPVVAQARTWLGVRWRHQGRSRDGVDCVGLAAVCVQQACGLEVPLPDYPRATSDGSMLRVCRQYLRPVSLVDMAPGDIVVLGVGDQRHMAIVGDYVTPADDARGPGLSLIHAYLPNRKVVEQRLDAAWWGRILAVFRVPEVA